MDKYDAYTTYHVIYRRRRSKNAGQRENHQFRVVASSELWNNRQGLHGVLVTCNSDRNVGKPAQPRQLPAGLDWTGLVLNGPASTTRVKTYVTHTLNTDVLFCLLPILQYVSEVSWSHESGSDDRQRMTHSHVANSETRTKVCVSGFISVRCCMDVL